MSFEKAFATIIDGAGDHVPFEQDMTGETLILWEIGDAGLCRDTLCEYLDRGLSLHKIVLFLRSEEQIPAIRQFVGDIGGVLLPNTSPQAMVDIVAAIRQGVCVYPPNLIPRNFPVSQIPGASSGSGDKLTDRENVILGHLRHGLCNKLIAAELGISGSTVRVHIRSIFRKLGVRNRTQAALWAVETYAA